MTTGGPSEEGVIYFHHIVYSGGSPYVTNVDINCSVQWGIGRYIYETNLELFKERIIDFSYYDYWLPTQPPWINEWLAQPIPVPEPEPVPPPGPVPEPTPGPGSPTSGCGIALIIPVVLGVMFLFMLIWKLF